MMFLKQQGNLQLPLWLLLTSSWFHAKKQARGIQQYFLPWCMTGKGISAKAGNCMQLFHTKQWFPLGSCSFYRATTKLGALLLSLTLSFLSWATISNLISPTTENTSSLRLLSQKAFNNISSGLQATENSKPQKAVSSKPLLLWALERTLFSHPPHPPISQGTELPVYLHTLVCKGGEMWKTQKWIFHSGVKK